MKTIIVLSFTFIFLQGYSQPYVCPQIGMSSIHTAGSLRFGYSMPFALIEGGVLAHIDQKNPAYFGAETGLHYPVGNITLTHLIGYNYRLVSTDTKSLNGFVLNFGLRAEYKTAVIEFQMMDGINFLTVGFRGLLTKKD